MKTCTACGEDKALDAYARCSKVRDGRKAKCKVCIAAAFARSYAPVKAANKQKRDELLRELQAATTKRCGRCSEVKEIHAFAPHKAFSQGRANWCKACYNAYSADYYAKTVDVRHAQQRAIRAAHPERHLAHGKQWRQDNPSYFRKHYAANKDVITARVRRYSADNPDVARAAAGRRRSRLLGAPGRGVSATEWSRVLADSMGVCAYCGERKSLTVDHVDALASGGAHDPDNLVGACLNCNSSKRTTSLVVWLARRAFEKAAA